MSIPGSLRNKIIIVNILSILSVLFSSCGIPGPLITYNREIKKYSDSTSVSTQTRLCYFCLDYDRNFECQKYKEVIIDTLSKKMVSKSVTKGTELRMRDGRKKIKKRTKQYSSTGKLKIKTKSVHQTYGIRGRLTHFREIEFLENGQKKISVKRGTKKNPQKLDLVRYRGHKY